MSTQPSNTLVVVRRLLVGAALLLWWLGPARALAAGDSGAADPPATPTPGDLATNRIGAKVSPGYIHNKSHWGTEATGWFVSGRVDLGTFFLKPRVSFGYGRAHWSWIGLDLNPIFSTEGVGSYGGLRIALPFVDLRVGARYRYTFFRSFLERKEIYFQEDIELRGPAKSKYLSWEAELTGGFPLGPGSITTELAGTYITLVPDGLNVYEETLRVVAEPPWVWRALVGYQLAFLSQNALRIGAVVQFLHVPRRDRWIVRAGAVVRFRLAYNLELRGTFVPVVAARDELGLSGGDSFLLGVRYLWAHRLR